MEAFARTIVAPFPYFGGKRRVAAEVWARFGDVRSYVEPFFGSGAVLLARPRPFRGVETVNDLDGLLCNFWRAVKAAPQEVAAHADWPVSECDLTARHLWLVERRASITERLCADPDWFDAQAAGWWVWTWCNAAVKRGLFTVAASPGCAAGPKRSGAAALRERGALMAEIQAIAERMSGVIIRSGDWRRVLQSPSMRGATGDGVEGIFLDPPYESGDSAVYSAGGVGSGIAHDVRAWAVEAGRRPDMRIALCGYDEHDGLADAGWGAHRWETYGGFGNKATEGAGRNNAKRETVWFSPHCLGARQPSLFGDAA